MSEAIQEYKKDEGFRALIDTGMYLYVDRHFCLDLPKYLTHSGSYVKMTDYAITHVDECCMRFKVVYDEDNPTEYRHGQLHSDNEYNEKTLMLSLSENGLRSLRQAQAVSERLLGLPESFSGTLCSHMQYYGVTVEELAEQSQLSESTILRLRREDKDTYSVDQVVALCIGLHLPPEFSDDMLEKAGITLRTQRPTYCVYRSLLRSMWNHGMEEIQRELIEGGLKPLKVG